MATASPSVRVSIRAFALALAMLPPAFRREFADEMTCDFSDSLDAVAPCGTGSVLRLWLGSIIDLLWSAPRLWLESGLPLIAGAAAMLALAVATAAASLRPVMVPIPDVTNDRDIRVLMLLGAVVLVVIANTLIVSLWFLRPLLTRDRKLTPCSKRGV